MRASFRVCDGTGSLDTPPPVKGAIAVQIVPITELDLPGLADYSRLTDVALRRVSEPAKRDIRQSRVVGQAGQVELCDGDDLHGDGAFHWWGCVQTASSVTNTKTGAHRLRGRGWSPMSADPLLAAAAAVLTGAGVS